MARTFHDHFSSLPLVGILRAKLRADLEPAVRAIARGGITCQEITLNTPDALRQITRLRKDLGDVVCLGAGTILSGEDCKQAIEAGAVFIVTPTLQLDSIAICSQHKVPIFCGAYTPTEALAAHRAGATFIKIFPADTYGPKGIKAMLAPLDFLKIVPTGGVSVETVGAYLDAGCAGMAIGGDLFSESLLKAADWTELESRARRFTDAYRVAQSASSSKIKP